MQKIARLGSLLLLGCFGFVLAETAHASEHVITCHQLSLGNQPVNYTLTHREDWCEASKTLDHGPCKQMVERAVDSLDQTLAKSFDDAALADRPFYEKPAVDTRAHVGYYRRSENSYGVFELNIQYGVGGHVQLVSKLKCESLSADPVFRQKLHRASQENFLFTRILANWNQCE